MPLMTQIRNNLTKLFAVFAVFFIVYIVLDWGMDITDRRVGGAGDEIGKVNKSEISYRDFAELLRQQTEGVRRQTGSEPDEETERQLRTQVWNALVQQALIEQELDRLGITVTDDEIRSILLGPNPPEMVASQFRDSLGVFNRAAYDRAVADPQNRQAWVQIESEVRRQRRLEKLQSILFAAARATEGEIRQRYVDENVTMEAEYVLFDPNRLVHDSLVQITNEDLRRHYNATQEEFKVRPARKVKYVFFSLAPSKEDSLVVREEMNRILEQAGAGMDFLELAKAYSEVPVEEKFVKHGELGAERENAVFSAKKGDIVGPIVDFEGYHLIRVIDERRGSSEYVRASHVLIRQESGADTLASIQKARQVLRQARAGVPFEDLAREQSEDFGSKVRGGDLGWTGRGGWVKPFEDAAFGARVGEIVGPVRTPFGWHVIKVTGRDSREVKIATLTMKVKPSPQSVDLTYQRAEDFAYFAKEEGFEKSAEFSSYQVRETPEFTRGSVIPGIGMNDAVMNFAFSRKLNAISDPISVTGGVAVFKVSGVREEGVRPLEEVTEIVRAQVMRRKKFDMIREQADAFRKPLTPETDLLAAAASLRGVSAQRVGPFKATDAPAGVGRDLTFIGTCLALEPGQISSPFEGSRGIYIVKLIAKTPFDSTQYARKRLELRDQILQEKRSRLFSDWLTVLREQATIIDNRDRFFR